MRPNKNLTIYKINILWPNKLWWRLDIEDEKHTHSILLHKMSFYGVNGVAYDLLKNLHKDSK